MNRSSSLCVHTIFELRAASTPGATALVCGDESMTYQELNERANQLAWELIAKGVGPDVPVGISMNRSFELIIGILGILKAGGAYVSLEPSYPEDPIEFMVRDAGLNVILVQERSAPRPSFRGTTVLPVGMKKKDSSPIHNPDVKVTSDNLVYVAYTSGSTGTPKGVEIVHRAVIRLVIGVDYATLDKHQVFLHLSSLSFDASTFEIWGALLHGARCVLFAPPLPTLEDLERTIVGNHVTTLWLTSSLFNTVIDEAPAALTGVSQLLIGGEVLSLKHVRKALGLLPMTQIINGYGPTENTTFTCCYRIPREMDENVRSIPIGRPISRTAVYILDENLTEVPPGQQGELYAGGDGLARGYVNRPDLTDQKFIRNLFDPLNRSRLYRTGDLVRLLDDGNIEFLGRVDDQVKLRGFRIELGEIESVIGGHPLVKEGAVRVHLDESGEKTIAAYVVPNDVASFSVDSLREYLKGRLPHYMIPSYFITMDALPKTAGNKVDRRMLLPRWESRRASGRGEEQGRTEIERRIAEVWRAVLRFDGFGVDDNFFEVGGQSLAAVRVHRNLQEALNREIPITALFQYPTIRLLANFLSSSATKTMSTARERAQRQALALAQRHNTARTGRIR